MVKKILISIDHKWRDLPGHVFIGSLLKKNNFVVYYCRAGNERYYVEYFKPDILLINHVRSITNEHLSLYLKNQRNVQVYILPTEGIATLKKYTNIGLGATSNLDGVEKIFSWSNFTKKIFKKDKNIVTGVTRFDFYNNTFKNFRLSKTEFINKYSLNKNFSTILIATNFTQAGFFKKNRDFHTKDSINQKYNQFYENNYKGIYNIAKLDYQSRDLLIKSLKKIIDKNKNRNYLLKLHPSEEHLYYFEKLKNYDVKFIINEYIWNIIPYIDVEINRSCTTSFEAWLMDKPTIEFRLNPNEFYISNDHSAGSFTAKTIYDLDKSIDDALSDPIKFINKYKAKRKKILNKLLGSVDGKRSEFLVNNIIKFSRNNNANWKSSFWFYKIIGFLLQWNDYQLHDIKVYGFFNYLRGNKIDKLGRFDKYIHKKDIKFWESKFNNIYLKK